MKFRITSKDLIIFVIFCLFLLYLCAISVLNFINFGAEGRLWGLNPIPAFSGVYLPITLLLFFVALIMIFSSVSSYIFEKDGKKGLGIIVKEKEEKGYSNWAKDKDIKTDRDVEKIITTDPTLKAAGVPLCTGKNNEMWVDNGEYHTLVIGSSGSGKSRCVVKPMVNLLAKKGESMIITDPKGELYVASANKLKELGYKVIVLNFRDPLKGNAWNPLTLPYQYYKNGNMDKATELLDDVALNILYDANNKGEPFWERSAADYFSGLALGLFQDAKEEEININSISLMATVGDERLGASNYSKEYFLLKGESSSAYTFASGTINAPNDTKGGIVSTFRQKIRLFASRENLSEMLGHSDFSILDIGREKTAVFIVVHDEKTTYHALATIFIKQCYETLIDVAQENSGKLPIRTNFILDEFANMPPLKDVDSMVTAARSRQMRFTFIIQNFAQLNDVYGKEVAEVIRGNCGNTIYLISTELAALEEISKMCGEVKSKEKDKTASTPLVTVTDLQKLKLGEAILMRIRKSPFKTKLPFNDKVDWGYQVVDANFPQREAKPVALFDMKAFVNEKKKEKSMANFGNNPFGSPNGFGSNPFDIPINPFASNNPFAASNPFGSNPQTSSSLNPFDNNKIDLDAMMRDIDKKIAELDAEEARQKEALNNKLPDNKAMTEAALKNLEDSVKKPNIDDYLGMTMKFDSTKLNEAAKEESKKLDDKVSSPKIEPVEPKVILPDPIMEAKSAEAKPIEEKPKEEVKVEIPELKVEESDVKPEPMKVSIDTNYELPNYASVTDAKDNDIVEILDEEPKPEIKTTPVTNDNLVIESNKEDKPKINVDVDSVVVNNNIISDDEFFDDFFGDDDY